MKLLLHEDSSGGSARCRFRAPSNPHGKIHLGVQTVYSAHRCGWSYALEALLPEHNDQGVLFDGFLDQTFDDRREKRFAEPLPYARPWIGFFHDPPGVPANLPIHRLQDSLASESFRASLPYCRGLLALSEYLGAYLRRQLEVPVSVLLHPTEIPARTFDYAAFLANRNKKVVTLGWWLRRWASIFRLPLDGDTPYRKCHLLKPKDNPRGMARARTVLALADGQHADARLARRYRDNTDIVPYLPNSAYDDLLSKNLVFLDLYDASANNAVVECIARATPLLINPLPAVVEYLGNDYPFYFKSLGEAAAKALDFRLVQRTHEYLLDCPTRACLSQDCFLHRFRGSAVYRNLGESNAPACSMANAL